MRIVSFGDLFTDYYFKKGVLVGLCGGKSNANIIAHLSKYYSTAFFGCVGDDDAGMVALASLSQLNVDTTHIKKIPYPSKKFFIEDGEYDTVCPYCHRKRSYSGLKFTSEDVIPYLKDDDVFILDNANATSMEIIHSIEGKAFIDLGYLGNLAYASLGEIEELLANRFEIINMNERVYNFLKRKFAIDSLNLYDLLKPKILIITRGKRGADIIYDGILIKKEIEDAEKEVDSSGAGDAFFAEFIHEYLNSDKVDEKFISKAYIHANSIARVVVNHLGARSHLQRLYRITDYSECICGSFHIK